jgi:hypothetical protein
MKVVVLSQHLTFETVARPFILFEGEGGKRPDAERSGANQAARSNSRPPCQSAAVQGTGAADLSRAAQGGVG